MEKNFNNRLQLTMLALITLGLVALAALNFWQDRNFQQPGDGVWWREVADGSGLLADKVLPNSPGKTRRHSSRRFADRNQAASRGFYSAKRLGEAHLAQ